MNVTCPCGVTVELILEDNCWGHHWTGEHVLACQERRERGSSGDTSSLYHCSRMAEAMAPVFRQLATGAKEGSSG